MGVLVVSPAVEAGTACHCDGMASFEFGELLSGFTLKASDDPVKVDLELICERCDSRLCDAESGDTLDVLVDVAVSHSCTRS